jgi:DNA-binding beta-propeller fold protein YncE
MIAITPNGKTAYVAATNGLTPREEILKPITTATNTVGKTITVGSGDVLAAMAFSPSGKRLYLLGYAETGNRPGFVVAVSTATRTLGKQVAVGPSPSAMAITP